MSLLTTQKTSEELDEQAEAPVADWGAPQTLQAGYMLTRLFGTSDVVRAVQGASYAQLKRFLELGIFKPEAQAANGKGSRRYFTVKNLVEAQVAVELAAAGLEPSVIKRGLETLH